MNHLDVYSPDASSRVGSSRRPATISELAERANRPWDESKGFKYHLKLAEKYLREGKEHARVGDVENAFVELAKAATLIFEGLPEHPDYHTKLNATQRHNLGLNGQEILDNLDDLKPALVDRYERWRQEHPDDVDQDTTPNARSQQSANDNAARARAQRELQIREEEAARILLQQLENDNARAQPCQQELPGMDDPYEKSRQEHPDGVDEVTTPNISTQQLSDAATERARVARRQLQTWIQQREQAET